MFKLDYVYNILYIEHMKVKGYWIKENCKKESLKYTSKKEFKLNASGAFMSCRRNGWLDELCKHMIPTIKPKGYWNKERCEEVSKLCYTRSDFCKKFPTAYKNANKNGWLDELCKHMIVIGNLKKRLVYAFEFTDKSIYIGLTCNIHRRKKEHMNNEKLNSVVYKYKKETGLEVELKLLTDYIELEEAIVLEKYYIDFYKNSEFNVLNKKAGGDIGNIDKVIWCYDKCKQESLKYKTKTEFHDKNQSAHKFSLLNGWLDDFYKTISKKLILNYDICKQESLKYKTKSQFRKSRTIYNYSSKNKWLDDFYKK